MDYEKIKTPEELMEYMDKNILYGFYDYKNHKKYYGNDKNFNFLVNNFWTLSTPTNLQKYNVGHCFDQVELERDFLLKIITNLNHFLYGLSVQEPIHTQRTHTLFTKIKNQKTGAGLNTLTTIIKVFTTLSSCRMQYSPKNLPT